MALVAFGVGVGLAAASPREFDYDPVPATHYFGEDGVVLTETCGLYPLGEIWGKVEADKITNFTAWTAHHGFDIDVTPYLSELDNAYTVRVFVPPASEPAAVEFVSRGPGVEFMALNVWGFIPEAVPDIVRDCRGNADVMVYGEELLRDYVALIPC